MHICSAYMPRVAGLWWLGAHIWWFVLPSFSFSHTHTHHLPDSFSNALHVLIVSPQSMFVLYIKGKKTTCRWHIEMAENLGLHGTSCETPPYLFTITCADAAYSCLVRLLCVSMDYVHILSFWTFEAPWAWIWWWIKCRRGDFFPPSEYTLHELPMDLPASNQARTLKR